MVLGPRFSSIDQQCDIMLALSVFLAALVLGTSYNAFDALDSALANTLDSLDAGDWSKDVCMSHPDDTHIFLFNAADSLFEELGAAMKEEKKVRVVKVRGVEWFSARIDSKCLSSLDQGWDIGNVMVLNIHSIRFVFLWPGSSSFSPNQVLVVAE